MRETGRGEENTYLIYCSIYVILLIMESDFVCGWVEGAILKLPVISLLLIIIRY